LRVPHVSCLATETKEHDSYASEQFVSEQQLSRQQLFEHGWPFIDYQSPSCLSSTRGTVHIITYSRTFQIFEHIYSQNYRNREAHNLPNKKYVYVGLHDTLLLFLRKRYGHGGRVHEIKITDTAEITIAGTNPNPEP